MHFSELKNLHVTQLVEMAVGLEIDNANRMRTHELIFAILKAKAKRGEPIFGDGTLEVLPDGLPMPSPGAEPDGQLTLEWHKSAYQTLSVSVTADGDLAR